MSFEKKIPSGIPSEKKKSIKEIIGNSIGYIDIKHYMKHTLLYFCETVYINM